MIHPALNTVPTLAWGIRTRGTEGGRADVRNTYVYVNAHPDRGVVAVQNEGADVHSTTNGICCALFGGPLKAHFILVWTSLELKQ